ncbi:hypothetical protein RvY_01639 [Ramazzottius varieornatus]|uniref:Uncharacterized protein n=1 Tax=Ramazzottius varieornatus TaxID=947166 RepID=A0A1D1URQ1_RAMVA|nr:hypothetical protein RvY_01639 [Ramazzottius varieornatus]
MSAHWGGPGNQTWNMIPQNHGENRGPHARMSKEVADYVRSGDDRYANITADLAYEAGSRRPANISYETTGASSRNHSDIQLYRRDFYPNRPTQVTPENIRRVDTLESDFTNPARGSFWGFGKS